MLMTMSMPGMSSLISACAQRKTLKLFIMPLNTACCCGKRNIWGFFEKQGLDKRHISYFHGPPAGMR